MYNRYIPQPDGSYRRSQIHTPEPEPRRPAPQPECCPPEKQDPPPPPPKCPPEREREPVPPCRQNIGAADFLRQLLPKGLDTGDLLIILLLLLMAGDCKEDRNTALLTLVLYLFM